MKKIISIIMILSVLGLCGCGAVEKISEMELPPVPTAVLAEDTSTDVSALDERVSETMHKHIIINSERSELQAFDPQQGTELILRFSYVTPYVHIPGNTAAEENINEYIAMLNESFYTGDNYGDVYDSGCAPGYINMLTLAEDNYNYIINSAVNFEGEVSPLGCHRTVYVDLIEDGVISLTFHDIIKMGNGQEYVGFKSYNFDCHSGELMTLDSLSDDSEAMKAFVVLYIQEHEGRQFDIELMEGNWYFSHWGLHIVTESEVPDNHPDVNGTWEYLVPYSALEGYVKPEYIREEITDTASFSVVSDEAQSGRGKEIIDMLKVSEDGQTVYFVADGRANDVRISRVDYLNGFYDTERLWYCSVMEDCALQIVTDIPEGMPELKLSYRDATGEHELYLSQSGVDGSFIFVDGSIEAVG